MNARSTALLRSAKEIQLVNQEVSKTFQLVNYAFKTCIQEADRADFGSNAETMGPAKRRYCEHDHINS